MLKKVFLQCMFGSPHPWIQPYLDHVVRLEEFGWHWMIFTPNKLATPSKNVHIVRMTLGEFDALVHQNTGVEVGNFLNGQNLPSKLISDFYCAFGQIFQDYIRDAEFWGITNFDMVYGRLDHFVPDSLLESLDVWADDVNAINGIFTLFRNDERINNLFRQVPDWEKSFKIHQPTAFDEIQMTRAIREIAARGEVRFGFPPYFGYHSYDRLIQHRPAPNLYVEPDGALIERYEDHTSAPARMPFYGREIMSFHFSKTKRWPL